MKRIIDLPKYLIIGLLLFAYSQMSVAEQGLMHTQYTCPMHPHYIANEFGSCPICGMDLVEMPSSSAKGQGESSQMNMVSPSANKPIVSVTPEMIQTMGIVTEVVSRDLLPGRIRLYSELEANPRLLKNLSGRVEGWVSRLNVQAVGDRVTKGEVLFVSESPTLLTAQKEFINALSSKRQSRILAAEQRLNALGVDKRVIKALRKSRKASDQVPFYASQNGVVSSVDIVEGDYLKPGSRIMSIQSYRQLWLQAYVPEEAMAGVDNATTFEIRQSNNEMSIDYQIDTIYPSLDVATRSGVVRLLVENPSDSLRPGQLLDVSLNIGKADVLSVPSQSIIRHSDSGYVVLALGDGRFTPQAIQTGIAQAGRTEITSGLKEGDLVVSSGQFMLDSESNLRDAFQKMQRRRIPLSEIEVTRRDLGLIDHLADAAIYLHKSIKAERKIQAMMLEPAIDITETLLPKFSGTQLESVLRDAQSAIKPLLTDASQRQAKASLAQLAESLDVWILRGQSDHYQNLGIELYQDQSSGDMWIEFKKIRLNSKPYNPYVSASEESNYRLLEYSSAVKQNAMDDMDGIGERQGVMNPMQMGGAHANH